MIITTGIPDGPVVSRQEIRVFLKDKDLTNIFVLAMERMMKVPQTDPSSWYQVGSIHGRPYVPYDGIGADSAEQFGGYCCHSSTLFPPWHRPYIALLEQFLGKHARDIANEFQNPKDKARYIKAAERFRFPYWDWATNSALPNLVAHASKIVVHRPDGTRPEIDNPLFGYKFNPVYEYFGDGLKIEDEKTWEAWQSTVRYPTTTDSTAQSKPHDMQKTLENNRLTLRDRTYNLLTQVTDWNSFSHDASDNIDPGPGGLDNIESLHNQMHVLAGKNGHMGVVDYAAYDPVFWLHHTNVDRLFALWQCLNPDQYVTPLASASRTFTRKVGELENAKSPLTPFRLTENTWWDADGVRDTRTFRYTYPELEGWAQLSKAEKSKRLRIQINKLYGRTGPVSAVKPSVFKKLNNHQTLVDDHVEAGMHISPGDWHSNAAEDKHHYHEWYVHIEVEKYSISGSFQVHIFLGDYDSDHTKWGMDPNLVGSHCIFANNAKTTGCAKCRDSHQKKKKVRGTLPLTSTLANRLGGVHELEPEKVVPYLQKNLHWTVQKHDDTVVPNQDVPGLKVTAGHTYVECPEEPEHFAKWGGLNVHAQATSGRHGGHR
ncbi:hypothetical protein BU17DRAFT_90486 [Hysterangium stoloniferum]|nr:hypothetical protein BU17DRAFT_90486 [Hysterangium stoloniferum]